MLCGPSHHYYTENIELLYSPLNKISVHDFRLYCSLFLITKQKERSAEQTSAEVETALVRPRTHSCFDRYHLIAKLSRMQ